MSSEKSKAIAKVAALELAADIESGKLNPATLDAELADAARALVGVVIGPADPLFDLQRDITRQVIHAGGLTADEVAEWLSVLRRRNGEAVAALETPEPPAAPDHTDDTESAASVTHSAETD